MSNLCIYHGGCTDGVAAAWAFNELNAGLHIYHPGVYQQPPPYDLIEAAHQVYLVDFSYKAPVMREIAARSNRPPIVLDHHATAQAQLEPLLAERVIGGVFDMNRCGALITWQWFTDKPPPPMMVQIDLSDRRAPGYSDETKGTMLALRTRPHAPDDSTPEEYLTLFKRWDWLMDKYNFERLSNEGKTILPYYNQRVDEHVNQATLWTIGEHDDILCVNAPYYLASDVAGELAETSPSHIGAVYRIEADGRVEFSLRSCDYPEHTTPTGAISEKKLPAPHVGEFAQEFAGGGGHPKAAGFAIPYDYLNPVDRFVGRP